MWVQFLMIVRTTPVHSLTSARTWKKRRSDGYCAEPDCWLQRLPKKNLLKRNSAARTQVYARQGRRGWTGRRTTSYPGKHCRLREMTVLPMLELWFRSVLDDRASFFADDLCLTLIPCALALLLSLLLPPPVAVSTVGGV